MAQNILLKKLHLKKFKGVHDLCIDFQGVTNIYGDNGTGKTSVFDAFTWLLFDKDSHDRVVGDKESNFQIKTYDGSGNIINGLEHCVTGILNVDGKDLILSKTYKEKWTKKKGEAERQLTGHETLYYINEVPVKQSEYKSKISSLIDESLFKLISNPIYFSTNLKWQDRRKALLDIIGDIHWNDVINNNPELKPLVSQLNESDIETIKKSTAAKKRKANDNIKSIPFRIDEINNSIENHDFEALRFQKRSIESAINSIDEKIINGSKSNEEALEQKNLLNVLKYKLKNIEDTAKHEAEAPFRELKAELKEIQFELSSKENELIYKNREINRLIDDATKAKEEAERLRQLWYAENSKIFEFDESLCTCPTCKRTYETDDIEATKQKLLENFNQNKAEELEKITELGKEKSEQFKNLQEQVKEINTNELKEVIKTLKEVKERVEYEVFNFEPQLKLEENKEYQETLKEIKEVEEKLNVPTEFNINILELKNKKGTLQADLEQINNKLAAKEQNKKLEDRKAELLDEERRLAQLIANLEQTEYLCEEFIKTKVNLLESSINERFKYVKFKLFDIQVNGGVNECCEALINGVPFSNANTASQYNAGLDIINALSNHYNVHAPIFIDGRESVNELIETDSQIVNLIVSNDKVLKIENSESEVA